MYHICKSCLLRKRILGDEGVSGVQNRFYVFGEARFAGFCEEGSSAVVSSTQLSEDFVSSRQTEYSVVEWVWSVLSVRVPLSVRRGLFVPSGLEYVVMMNRR